MEQSNVSSGQLELCDSPFWDTNYTWNSNQPRLTKCFRFTTLIWFPTLFLLLAINNHIWVAKRPKILEIPWNKFNITRLTITGLLILIKSIQTLSELSESRSSDYTSNGLDSISTIVGPMIQLLNHTSLFVLYTFQRKAGIHTSGSVWFYSFSLLICEFLRYYAIMTYAPLSSSSLAYRLAEYGHFTLVLKLFLLECYGDQPNVVYEPLLNNSHDSHKITPLVEASFGSFITFDWITKFIWSGFRNGVSESDLWKCRDADRTAKLGPKFMSAWRGPASTTPDESEDTYQSSDGSRYRRRHIFKVIFRLCWRQLLLAAILKLCYDSMFLTLPLVLKYLIRFMLSDEPRWHGVLYGLLFLIAPTLQSLFLCHYFWQLQVLGIHLRSMIRGAIYRKSFLIDGVACKQSTTGELVNLMAIDAQRFDDLLLYINYFWSAPLQIVFAITMLYRDLGWPVFAGILSLVLMMPVLFSIGRYIKLAQAKMMIIKDDRMKQINALLSGIQVVKLYAWESSFMQHILNLRSKEVSYLRRIYNIDALQVFIWNTAPMLMAVSTFTAYIKSDENNIFDAEKAFVSLSWFVVLKYPLANLPIFVNNLMLSLVSAKRLSDYMNRDELVHYVARKDLNLDRTGPEDTVISVKNGCLAWNSEKETVSDSGTSNNWTLKNINLNIKRGSFVGVVGQVGSGKSSLISGLIGEMRHVSGQFEIHAESKVAYVPQEAWIQNMTLRNNILFGNDYVETTYASVLRACSLLPDIEILPGRDETEIGEKGINISGGQKQRTSLARACYSNSDIYLMDDVLSALDSNVAKYVFTEVLSSSCGLLKNKTRILATNNLFVLPYVDQVIVLRDGEIVECGSYDELMMSESGQLSEMMRQYNINQVDSENTNQNPSLSTNAATNDNREHNDNKLLIGTNLISSESMETGSVSYKVYMEYFRSISFKLLSIAIIILVMAATFNIGTNFWLSIWSDDASDPTKAKDQHLRNIRILGYGLLIGSNCLMIILGTLTFAQGVVRSSKKNHYSLISSIMRVPISFFETTPVGRITNRFSKDIDVIDSVLPTTLRIYILVGLYVASNIILTCSVYPEFLLLIVPIGIAYYLIQKIYIVTTRQLRRLESIMRSPILSSFSETLEGLASIRVYNCKDRFVENSDKLIDMNNICSLMNIAANRWLGLRLDLMSNLITTSIAIYSVLSKDHISVGLAAFVITSSSSSIQFFGFFVRLFNDLETNIVSVERVIEYSNIEPEDVWIKEKRPDADWPRAGAIDIEDFSARYRSNTPLVLSNLNINIKAGEKIGVLGRTGSGKSSFSLCLFRMLEPASGKICIDGEDIRQLGLHDLRSKLTIIPQDPVIFAGTIRFNLDPLKLNSDLDIWRALELAHLRTFVNGLEGGLDSGVKEFGRNFSIGQRQLICLARAILRGSKILVLDEATASVDIETDLLIQKTIREVFRDCTIITIAHRLHTILDSDRVLVLDQGTIKELDEPSKLIDMPDSTFVSLLNDAGIDHSAIFKSKDTKE